MIAGNKECNPLSIKETVLYKRLTGDNGRLKAWDIITALATPVTNIRGSHKVLPMDDNIARIVKKELAKNFPQVLE